MCNHDTLCLFSSVQCTPSVLHYGKFSVLKNYYILKKNHFSFVLFLFSGLLEIFRVDFLSPFVHFLFSVSAVRSSWHVPHLFAFNQLKNWNRKVNMHSQVGPQSIIHILDVILKKANKSYFSLACLPCTLLFLSPSHHLQFFHYIWNLVENAMLSFFVPVFLSTSNYFSLAFLLITASLVKGQSVHPNVKKVYVAPTTWLNLSVLRWRTAACVTLP